MPSLVWDKIDERVFETGLDRGVLYLSDGSAVPWNGLTSVVEKNTKESSPVYFDGMKINNLVSLGDFEATLSAITYPDEFVEIEGLGRIRNGIYAGDQPPQVFALSYRTKIGNALDGDSVGYKIHIVYNAIAIVSDKTHATASEDPSLVEFEWDILAVPEEVPGIRPTAHFILDSRYVDPWLMEDLEGILYGDEDTEPSLPSIEDFLIFTRDWYRLRIIDNGDGTWTAISARYGEIVFDGDDDEIFSLLDANVVYLDDSIFIINDTYDIADSPLIKFINNGNGTWTAITSDDSLFTTTPEGWFQILNANATFIGPDKYQVSDTPS